MLSERRRRILNLVAECYIRSAHPVPSSLIAEKLGVSSATVRNEFSVLEEEGYLQQPHTSSGRIPTPRGFRAYAASLLPPKSLPAATRRRWRDRLGSVHGEDPLEHIARVTAELSGYAVLVGLPPDDSLQTLEIHLSPLSSSRLLAVAVLATGLVRQLVVPLEPIPPDDVISEAESSLRQLTVPLGEVPHALTELARRAHDELARTLRALAREWPGIYPPRLYFQGLKYLLTEPESRDPEFLRVVVEQAEGPAATALTLAPEATAGEPNDHAIGDGTILVVLDDTVARVAARLMLGAAEAGLMLLGPARMRYPEALMVARGVSEILASDAPFAAN